MATLSELTNLLSRVTGIPAATVFAYGRFAREAGLISQGGRGRGGAEMSYGDAANLLIALCGTSVTREAGPTIKSYRATTGWLSVPDRRHLRKFNNWLRTYDSGDPQVDANEVLSLGRFLERVLRMAGNGELEAQMRRVPSFTYTFKMLASLDDDQSAEPDPWALVRKGIAKPRDPSEVQVGSDVSLRLEFNRNHGLVNFEINHMWGSQQKLACFTFSDMVGPKSSSRAARAPGRSVSARDFSVIASVSDATLFALGLAVAGKPIPEQLLTEPRAARRLAGSRTNVFGKDKSQ